MKQGNRDQRIPARIHPLGLLHFLIFSAFVNESGNWRQAEASGAYGDAKLQKLKSGMNKLEKALQKDITKVLLSHSSLLSPYSSPFLFSCLQC